MRLCKRGHDTEATGVTCTGYCRLCHRANDNRYSRSEKGKRRRRTADARYSRTGRGCAMRRAWYRSEKGKAAKKRGCDRYHTLHRESIVARERQQYARMRLVGSRVDRFWMYQYLNAE